MQNINNPNQAYFFSLWSHLGPIRQRLLEESWAGLFREYLLKELPVGVVAPHFHPTMGRPTKELYTVLGTLVLQQLNDLSDSEVIYSLAFDMRWHYALDITGNSDATTTICERTLRTYRKIVIERHLEDILFGQLTDKLIDAFNVDTSKQRIDSVHLCSNMRRLGRIGLFTATIRKFLKNLKRKYPKKFKSAISDEMRIRYLEKNGDGCFSRQKPSESRKTLEIVSTDLFLLVERFRNDKKVSRLNSFHLLERVLREQCTISEDEDGTKKVEVKPPKEVPSDSLQNPSDPDATYDGYKGQGYQAQILETYTTEEEKDETTPHIITYIEVEPAHKSDEDALNPALEETRERDCAPEKVTADAHYGSDENVEEARKQGVEVTSPVMGKEPENLSLDDFSFHDSSNRVKSCPEGHEPEKVEKTKNGKTVARFSLDHCTNCPMNEQCPVKIGKKAAYLRYTSKQARLARRRKYEKTSSFNNDYRWRAGIEGTNSHLKYDTGAGRIRVRGSPSMRYVIKLKALALNILRATCAQNARKKARNGSENGAPHESYAIFCLKILFSALSVHLLALFAQIRLSKNGWLISEN